MRNLSAGTFRTRPHRSHLNSQSPTGRRVREFEAVTDGYLKDAGQRAVGSVGPLLVREPPAPKAVHGVGGDGLAKLFKGVVSVPALFDLVEQFGQFARHSVVCEETGRQMKEASGALKSPTGHLSEALRCVIESKLHSSGTLPPSTSL